MSESHARKNKSLAQGYSIGSPMFASVVCRLQHPTV